MHTDPADPRTIAREGSSDTTLFVGNYDDGIHVKVVNIDDAFAGTTTGELARKCVEVAPRAIHMLGEEDAALLYAPVDEVYLDYCQGLYGFRPRVLFPKQRYTDLKKPLSLLAETLQDEELVSRIAREGRGKGWSLSPFIGNARVFELARRTGLPVLGFGEHAVNGGKVAELNDKSLFQLFCRAKGIPTPDSVHVRGWDRLVETAGKIFAQDGQVMLRRARAAGGLGNCQVTATAMAEAGADSLEAYLLETLEPLEEWENETVLVEPVLDIVGSPTVLAKVRNGDAQIVDVIDQVLKGMAFIGGNFPTEESPETVALLEAWTMCYLLEFFIPEGGEGWVDIDFGRTRSGKLVAFESNGRYTGNNHGRAVRKRLCTNGLPVHAWTNDALKVRPGTSFEQVRDRLGNLLFDPANETGVVITIPPGGNDEQFSMGYIALGQDERQKLFLRDAMDVFARSTWSRL